MKKPRTNLIFVDCEAWGPCPSRGQLTEFGACTFPDMLDFHGVIAARSYGSRPEPGVEERVLQNFRNWLRALVLGQPVFVSDNPAWDWQWINDGFHRVLGGYECSLPGNCKCNPFGHSARRISDFYAGLKGDFRKTQEWKRLRRTKHDHHPVNDTRGNAEAFQRILDGEL